jgi:type IV fimbrial biogenesis protein FimT
MDQFVQLPTSMAAPVERGFTLIETMVVVALMAILAALAAPSFIDTFERYRVDSARESLMASISLARTDAIRRGQRVVLRRNEGCVPAPTGNNDWRCGWTMFVDQNEDAILDAGEPVIQSVTLPSNVMVRKNGAVTVEFLVINRLGQAQPVGGYNFSVLPLRGNVANEVNAQTVCFTTGTRVRWVRGMACA